MAYDQESFLAGVAVGRNMKSWPVLDGKLSGVFALEVVVDAEHAGTSIKGLNITMFAKPWSIFISWGDGAVDSFIEQTSVSPQHTYLAAGVYTQVYIGIPDWAEITSVGLDHIAPFVRAVLTPFPRLREGIVIPPALKGATILTEICDNLYTNFRYREDPLWYAYQLFTGCSSLTEVGNSLLSGITLRDGGHITELFNGCTSLRSVGDIFHGNGFSGVTEVSYAFSGCTSLKTIQEGIFRTMPNLERASTCFSNSGLTEIPARIFAENPNLQNVSNCFAGTEITDIPAGLFANNSQLKYVIGCFARTKITSIPEGLFSQCPNIESFEGCFEGCSDIVGNVPALWEQYPDANGEACFRGCVNAANYEDIPLEWRRREI